MMAQSNSIMTYLQGRLDAIVHFLRQGKEAVHKSMVETYVDKKFEEKAGRLVEVDNEDRSLLTGFLGFRRADYSGVKGKFLIAWDVFTWVPTVLVNAAALFTEVVPLSLINVYKDEKARVEKHNETNEIKENVGYGYKASYVAGSILYYFGRALTSPAKNIQDCFKGWKEKSTWGKVTAVGKAIGSALYTSLAYAILLPVIAAAIAATTTLTLFGATICGGGYLLSHAITGIASLPVIGPAINTVGSVIMKTMNEMPILHKLVTWLMPSRPQITIIPGNPAETISYNLAAKAAAERKVQLVINTTGTGFFAGLGTGIYGAAKSATSFILDKLSKNKDNVKNTKQVSYSKSLLDYYASGEEGYSKSHRFFAGSATESISDSEMNNQKTNQVVVITNLKK